MREHFWLCVLCLTACAQRAQAEPAAGARLRAGDDTREAATYSSEPSPGGMLGDAVDEPLGRALASACATHDLEPDGRLSELARAVARAGQGQAPSGQLVSFHARRLGLGDPTPQLWLSNADSSERARAALPGAIARAASGEPITHCGGAAVRGGYGVIVAVALSRRLVTFKAPIPRRVEAGASIKLSARLARGYGEPILAITAPSGKVQRSALGRGPTFQTELRLAERGTVIVELLASGPVGPTIVALLELYVGVAPPRGAPRAESSVEHDADAVADGLATLIARERKQRGLSALSVHAGLREVALGHSRDMIAHHFVGHTSPETGEAQQRVARAGLRTIVLLENIGRGYSAAEIHGGLMESPGHRANILSPDVRSLGIGVETEQEGTRQAFVVTELFARVAAATDLKSAQRDLFALIAARRKARGLSPLALDPALSRAAQAAADAFVADAKKSEGAALARATRDVRALPANARALSAALVQAEELTPVADSRDLYAGELVALGIGVAAQPRGAARSLAIVLLLAARR